MTRIIARLVRTATVNIHLFLRPKVARDARPEIVRPALTLIPRSTPTWIAAWHAILLSLWWIKNARKSVAPPPTVLVPAGMRALTFTYATLKKKVVFANFALQTLNAQRTSLAKIMSVQAIPIRLIVFLPAENAGNGVATLCVEDKKSVVNSATISIDAMNAGIPRTAARGKMAKYSATKPKVHAKIHASLAKNCILTIAIKKHLNSNAHAIHSTTPKDLKMEIASRFLVSAP